MYVEKPQPRSAGSEQDGDGPPAPERLRRPHALLAQPGRPAGRRGCQALLGKEPSGKPRDGRRHRNSGGSVSILSCRVSRHGASALPTQPLSWGVLSGALAFVLRDLRQTQPWVQQRLEAHMGSANGSGEQREPHWAMSAERWKLGERVKEMLKIRTP